MLSQAVVAAYSKPKSDGIHLGQLTVTSVSPCAYGTYLNFHHLDPRSEEADGYGQLRMKDGHWQEAQCIEDLIFAGFTLRFTGSKQKTVHIGKSQVTGRPDGLITVDGREDVLSVKAMSLQRYTSFREKGFEAEPFIKCQEQLYLASEEFKTSREGTWIYAKHKDSCRPYDIFEEKDYSYSTPIIEALDEIILGKAEVKKPTSQIALCPHCRHNDFCWPEPTFDMTGTKVLSIPEATEMWKEGKLKSDYGRALMEEARVVFEEHLGNEKYLLIDDLKITRIIQHRSEFDSTKFADIFGANRLVEVMTEKVVPQMRVSQMYPKD